LIFRNYKLISYGTGVNPDKGKELFYYKKACDLGDKDACEAYKSFK